MNEPILCSNDDHPRRTKAVARVSWPDGPYRPTTACKGDLLYFVHTAIEEGNTIRVEPIGEAIRA